MKRGNDRLADSRLKSQVTIRLTMVLAMSGVIISTSCSVQPARPVVRPVATMARATTTASSPVKTTDSAPANPKIPKVIFMLPGQGHNVVYLVDSSGSMLDSFDEVRSEMFKSIKQLNPESQKFHVIFFSATPRENQPRALVSPTPDNVDQCTEFLKTMMPAGQTDPISSIRRAFKVLPDNDDGRTSVIFLLTDGEFPDNPAVIDLVKTLNKEKRVIVNTILYHHSSKEGIEVLTKLAEDNGGKFEFVREE